MKNNILIAPSILSADFANLAQAIQNIENAGADMVHIDVMDGSFVPNITVGSCVIQSLRPLTKLPFDVHLMIQNPDKHIEDFVKAGADIITIHAETCIHLDRTIEYIKSFGTMVGVSIVPSTHENVLEYILNKIDLVLVMTVNPGFGGQNFLYNMLPKIKHIRQMIDDTGNDIMLQVDGGINAETAKLVRDAGANVLVSGNYIFNKSANVSMMKMIQLLKN